MGNFQKILKPTRARGLDTSTGEQIVGNQLLGDPSFDTAVAESTDGNSTTGTYWKVNDADLEITGGKAVWSAYTGSGDRRLVDNVSGPFTDVTARYRVTIVVSDYTDGALKVASGAYGSGWAIDSAGTFVFDFSPESGSGNLNILATKASDSQGDAVMSISDITVYKLESFSNNNHAQIYSGRALEFDGVTDYLSVSDIDGITTFDEGNAYTWAAWINIYSIASGVNWFLGKGSSHPNVFVRHTDGRLVFREGGSHAAYHYISTTALQINTWYRLVVTADTSNNMKCYINGVLDNTLSEGDSPYSGSGTFGVGGSNLGTEFTMTKIGGGYTSNSYPLDGMMSDFQIWNTTLTQDDVTYDYLNPEQLALNRGGNTVTGTGTQLTNSNLKLWYPMNEGHRGNQSYVLDASNTGIGDFMETTTGTTNPYMSEDTGWLTQGFDDGDTTIPVDGANEKAFYVTDKFVTGNRSLYFKTVSSDSNENIFAQYNFVAGTTYKFFARVWAIDQGNGQYPVLYQSDSRFQNSVQKIATAYGEWQELEMILTCDSSGIGNNQIGGAGSGKTLEFYIDEFWVKPINDKHNATTEFYGDNTISATNDKTMAGSNNWDAYGTGTTESVTGGKLRVTTTIASTTQGVELPVANAGTPVPGRSYRIRAKLKRVSGLDPAEQIVFYYGGVQGNITTVGGGGTTNRITDSEVEYETTVTATSASGNLLIVNWSTTTALVFEIDDVEIKEVGIASGWTDADQQLDIPQTALQSYSQMAMFNGLRRIEHSADAYISHASVTTLSFWFYKETTVGETVGFIDHMNWSGQEGYRVYLSDSNYVGLTRLYEDGGTAQEIETHNLNAIENGKWYHVALVIPAAAGTDNCHMYLDGHKMTFTTSQTMGQGSSTKFRAGYGAGLTNSHLLGCMTEIALYSSELTNSQILELYNDGKAKDARDVTTTNLVGYWKDNDISNDWVNLANPGTYDLAWTAAVTETMLITAGADSSRDSQGFFMNRQRLTNSINGLHTGSGSGGTYTAGAVVQDSSTLDITGAFTIGCWVKLKDFNYSYNLIQKKTSWNGAGYGIYIHKDHKKPYLEWAPSSGYQQFGGNTNSVDTIDVWYFFYAVHDPDGLHNSSTGIDSLYVAKTTDTSLTTTTKTSAGGGASMDDPVATNDLPLTIGNHYGGGQSSSASIHFTGEIDDVVVYNGALSPEQVLRNFKAGKRSHK
tara:strand:- start:45 stop:3659 length:3615 start_codon:yes stop_codon:yes gene_type:complete